MYVNVSVHLSVYVNVDVYVHVYVYMHMRVCMCVCVFVCASVHLFIYICMPVCMYVRMYVCMFICVVCVYCADVPPVTETLSSQCKALEIPGNVGAPEAHRCRLVESEDGTEERHDGARGAELSGHQ